MRRAAFQELRVYRLAEKLSDEIWKVVKRWSNFERDTVGKQMSRAADSIGANIAEGAGRGSFQDNRRFVKIARGSLNETLHFLRRAHCRGLITDDERNALRPLTDDLGPMLNAYLTSIGRPSSGDDVEKPPKGTSTQLRTTDH